MEERGWEHFSHQADMGLVGWGASVEQAFEEAAVALTAAVTTAPIAPRICVEVACEADTNDLLFVAWLNAIIYEMSIRQMLFGRYEVHISGGHLTGSLWGEPVDRQRHEPACEPKGATYTELSVSQDRDGRWIARCVVDV